MKSKYPNILFILSDQHRFCDIGYAGNRQVATPYLDSLADEAAVFDHAYSNCPVCVPARGTLLTGFHAFNHGAAANDMPINPQCHSIAHVLNDAGYNTAYIGKWNLGGTPRDRFIPEEERLGFQYWRGCNCNHDYMHAYYDDESNVRHPIEGYEPIAQTTLALDYLNIHRTDKRPWALWLSFGTPHDPYLCLLDADVDLCRRRERTIVLRGNVSAYREFDYIPSGSHHAARPAGQPESLKEIQYREHRPLFSNLRMDYAGYYRHIEYIDMQIGRLLHWLDANGLRDDTIVVYTSDHGNMLGSHGLLNKQWYYEESAHIPFVIRWPRGIVAGHRDVALGLVDVVPSLLGLAGISSGFNFDGTDKSASIRKPCSAEKRYVYLYSIIPAHQAWFREIFSWRAITDGHVLYATDQESKPIALYDLIADPLEMNSLIGDPSAELSYWQGLLCEQVERFDGFMPWQQLIKEKGLLDQWNCSQQFFGYPVIHE